jgi:hypothetical protein
MSEQYVSLLLKEFLQIERCPMAWLRLDLYLLRDETTVFYVGQSGIAFNRVWNHFYAGFKGRSLMGRFIVCNWPVSMRFTVELLNSRSSRFDFVQNDLNLSEQALIDQYRPCLNTVFNPTPTPIPAQYVSPYTSLKFRHHPQRCIQQAAQAIEAAQLKAWLESFQEMADKA